MKTFLKLLIQKRLQVELIFAREFTLHEIYREIAKGHIGAHVVMDPHQQAFRDCHDNTTHFSAPFTLNMIGVELNHCSLYGMNNYLLKTFY